MLFAVSKDIYQQMIEREPVMSSISRPYYLSHVAGDELIEFLWVSHKTVREAFSHYFNKIVAMKEIICDECGYKLIAGLQPTPGANHLYSKCPNCFSEIRTPDELLTAAREKSTWPLSLVLIKNAMEVATNGEIKDQGTGSGEDLQPAASTEECIEASHNN